MGVPHYINICYYIKLNSLSWIRLGLMEQELLENFLSSFIATVATRTNLLNYALRNRP